VAGYRFTANPGQAVTATYLPCSPPSECSHGYRGYNVDGSTFGSRDPRLIGYYEIPVPRGRYTVELETIQASFNGGSSVGPIDPPIQMPGTAQKSAEITVGAGQAVNDLDFVLRGTEPRFDELEVPISGLLWQFFSLKEMEAVEPVA
jgi:hypothetical protein